MLIDGARSVMDLNVEFNDTLAKKRLQHWKSENRTRTLSEVRRLAGIRELKDLPPAKVSRRGTIQRSKYRIEKLAIESEARIELPGLLFVPQESNGNRVLYLHGEGKHVDAQEDGPIEELVLQGSLVLAVDLRGIGETRTTGRDVMISYLLGKSLVGMRADDVLMAARVLSQWERKDKPCEVHLIASGVAEAPAIHAAALESDLFASLKVNGDTPSWSDVVRDPTTGRLSDVVHGALTLYDLPDLVSSYRSVRKEDSQP